MRIEDVLGIKESLGQIEIKGISDDSRSLKKGDLFFIIKRKKFDIFSVLKDIEPKVSAFVAQNKDKEKLKTIVKTRPLILVKNIKKEFHKATNIFYGCTNSDLKIIGITGTNGKTTTAFLIHHLLKKMQVKPSLIGTVKYLIGSQSTKANYTTPDFLSLRKTLKRIKDAGSRFVVMEVSSHALSQGRIKGIKFSRCVFTNLTRDHLDYHRTLTNYFNTKKKLFFQNKDAISLINTDDLYGKKIFNQLNNSISYGTTKGADFYADNIRLDSCGSYFDLIYGKKSYPLTTSLCGKHNILNILAAVGVVSSLGFPLSEIVKSLASFKPVEGRLQAVYDDLFVDYAHTPDALENVLSMLRQIGYKKIICVFGCGGNRDKGKRRVMGQIAQKRADFTFITSDNPRYEDAYTICQQIEKGFKSNNYSIVLDRKNAIAQAIKLFLVSASNAAESKKKIKTCVLVAGKGHEDYQIVGDKKLPFKDSNVIREVVQEIKHRRRGEACLAL